MGADSPVGPTSTLPDDWESLYTGPSMVKLKSIWAILEERGEGPWLDRDHSQDPD
jgi:hypothetical protein